MVSLIGLVFALFTVGYILGVWTACLVLPQTQREYEDGAQVRRFGVPAMVRSHASPAPANRR
jgi:hypothetical protein